MSKSIIPSITRTRIIRRIIQELDKIINTIITIMVLLILYNVKDPDQREFWKKSASDTDVDNPLETFYQTPATLSPSHFKPFRSNVPDFKTTSSPSTMMGNNYFEQLFYHPLLRLPTLCFTLWTSHGEQYLSLLYNLSPIHLQKEQSVLTIHGRDNWRARCKKPGESRLRKLKYMKQSTTAISLKSLLLENYSRHVWSS